MQKGIEKKDVAITVDRHFAKMEYKSNLRLEHSNNKVEYKVWLKYNHKTWSLLWHSYP